MNLDKFVSLSNMSEESFKNLKAKDLVIVAGKEGIIVSKGVDNSILACTRVDNQHIFEEVYEFTNSIHSRPLTVKYRSFTDNHQSKIVYDFEDKLLMEAGL